MVKFWSHCCVLFVSKASVQIQPLYSYTFSSCIKITTKFQLCACMQLMGYAQLNYSAILPLFMPTTTTYLQLSTQSSPKHPCFRVLREKALFFLLPFAVLGAQPTNKCIQQLQDFLDIPHIWIKVIQQCPIGRLCQSHKHFFN